MRRISKVIILLFISVILISCGKKPYVVFNYNCNGDQSYECELKNSKLNCNVITPVCEGYKFKGWYSENDNPVDLKSNFKANEIIYAKWEKEGESQSSNIEERSTIIRPIDIDIPSSSKEEPSSSEKPSSSKEEPRSSERPSSSKEEPRSSEKPSSSSEKPSSSREEPSSSQQQVTPPTPVNPPKPEETYTISFNLNGGSGGQAASISGVKYNQTLPSISQTKPSRGGHIFTGWYDKQTGGTQYYNSSNSPVRKYDKKSNITLYAGWNACPAGQYAAAGATSCSECTGNTYTSSTGQSSCKSCPSGQNVNSSHTGCNAKIYTVTLNSQGATSAGTSTIYLKYNTGWYSNSSGTTSITKITKPTKTGHAFEGYYTNANGGGTQIIDSSGAILSGKTTMLNSNSILYAYWVPYVLSIKYNGSDGTWNNPPKNTYAVNSSNTVIVKSTKKEYIEKLKYGESLPSTGLINYNGTWFGWSKAGASVVMGKEYIIDGTKITLDQEKSYDAKTLAGYVNCDLSVKNCSITLKVQFVNPIIIAGKKYHTRYSDITGFKGYPQNFAIANFNKSDEIFYLSASERGNISATSTNAEELAAIGTTIISKFTIDSNKKAKYISSMYLKNTGHGQPFDIDTRRNMFILNDYASHTINGSRKYGTNKGIMGITYSKINKGADFNKIFTYNLNESAPTPLLDNENNILGIRVGTSFKLYDYDYDRLKNGKMNFANITPKWSFKISRVNPTTYSDGSRISLQGFAIYNGFVYELTGAPGKDAYIEAFNFLGKSVYKVKLTNGYTTANSREPEGIKVYNKKIYIQTTYAINYSRKVDIGYYD